jgi:hypothetical protein
VWIWAQKGVEEGQEYDYAGVASPASGPDGGVSGFDLAALLAQAGDSCATPPNQGQPSTQHTSRTSAMARATW